MPPSCIYPGCSIKAKKFNPEIFHDLPFRYNDPELLLQWLVVLKNGISRGSSHQRKRLEESPPRVTSAPNLLPHETPSPCQPQHPCSSSSLPRSSPSLPRTPRSPSMEHSGRSLPSRTLTPLPPAPTTPLPLCPSPNPAPRDGIRHVSSTLQELRPQLHSLPTRSPYLEQRGSGQGAEGRDPQKQEWYTKYFSF